MSATFLQVYFVCIKGSTWEGRKKWFYFTCKALLFLEIIKFKHFRYFSSNAQPWNTKHMLLNNLGSKHSLVVKFGQFIYYHKINFFVEKICENCGLETSSRLFPIFKESSIKRNLRRPACWFGLISIALLLPI